MTNLYHLDTLFIPEDEGGWSGIVLNLPGCGSCGETYDECKANVLEAARGLIESYRDAGDPIPWRDSAEDVVPVRTTLAVEVTHDL